MLIILLRCIAVIQECRLDVMRENHEALIVVFTISLWILYDLVVLLVFFVFV